MNNIEKFVLMLKEKEMGNEIPSDELEFFNKMNEYYNTDFEFKNLVDLTMAATSKRELDSIINGDLEENNDETIKIPTAEIKEALKQETVSMPYIPRDDTPQGGTAKAQEEPAKVLTLKKPSARAGYADVLTLSLVSGFILGTATTILFILM